MHRGLPGVQIQRWVPRCVSSRCPVPHSLTARGRFRAAVSTACRSAATTTTTSTQPSGVAVSRLANLGYPDTAVNLGSDGTPSLVPSSPLAILTVKTLKGLTHPDRIFVDADQTTVVQLTQRVARMFNFPVGSMDFKLISKAKYLSNLGANLTSYGIRNGTENAVSG